MIVDVLFFYNGDLNLRRNILTNHRNPAHVFLTLTLKLAMGSDKSVSVSPNFF